MKKLLYDDVKSSFNNFGYKLLSKEYINARENLYFICPNGHEYRITWDNWKNGHRCGKCYHINFEKIKQSFEKENYILLTDNYSPKNKYLYFICSKGHKHKIEWRHWVNGVRCYKCVGKTFSKGEKEVVSYIKNIYNGIIIENDRKQIKNIYTNRFLELDIWLPEIKKAIEYNSMFIHNKPNVKIKDIVKKEQCKINNIELLIIDDNDWFRNKEFNKMKIEGFIYGNT